MKRVEPCSVCFCFSSHKGFRNNRFVSTFRENLLHSLCSEWRGWACGLHRQQRDRGGGDQDRSTHTSSHSTFSGTTLSDRSAIVSDPLVAQHLASYVILEQGSYSMCHLFPGTKGELFTAPNPGLNNKQVSPTVKDTLCKAVLLFSRINQSTYFSTKQEYWFAESLQMNFRWSENSVGRGQARSLDCVRGLFKAQSYIMI